MSSGCIRDPVVAGDQRQVVVWCGDEGVALATGDRWVTGKTGGAELWRRLE
jgi:hypothetical protein